MPTAVPLFTVEELTGGGRKKISDRYYQVEGVADIVHALRDGGRGQMRVPCGGGKTVMAQRCAELLCKPGGVVVVVAPSIALVAQTLLEWAANNDTHVALAVCSDDTVTDSPVTKKDLPSQVTTNPNTIAVWLRRPTSAAIRLIVGTHVSADVIGEGLQRAGLDAELLVVDEAHQAAGLAGKHTALVHDDARLPARRRIYATATPRVHRDDRRSDDTRLIGMDDESIFGPVLVNYPLATAIEDGYLDNYRLLVMGVTKTAIRQHLAGLPRNAVGQTDATVPLHTAMVQTLIAEAAAKFDLKRILVFDRRINEAAQFARTMPRTLAGLPAAMKPESPLFVSHIHGGMTMEDRDRIMQRLVHPPHGGWSVITNVRCLGVGVNVPAIDTVVFTHPKNSTIDIVQAVGRALRHDPEGSGVATIIVPILLPDHDDDARVLTEADIPDYKVLWKTLRALRAQDDVFGVNLDYARARYKRHYSYTELPLERVVVSLPDGYDDGEFLRHLTTRIVMTATHPWWEGLGVLERFHTSHGHTYVDRGCVADDDFPLGAWTERTRKLFHRKRLDSDRIDALNKLGFDFAAGAADFAKGFRAATDYRSEHGHLEPPPSRLVRGVELHTWLHQQRELATTNALPPHRRAALNRLGARLTPRPETYDQYVTALTAYRDEHGHIDIPADELTNEGHLGKWLIRVRVDRKLHRLTPEQIAQLDNLGIQWSPPATHHPRDLGHSGAPHTPAATSPADGTNAPA